MYSFIQYFFFSYTSILIKYALHTKNKLKHILVFAVPNRIQSAYQKHILYNKHS